tara:strand:+ start:626 stop:991 length:366 start_codon:yes stop_codon:yes gene_type:complete
MELIKLTEEELNHGELTKLNSKTWLFTYKGEEFMIKKDDTKIVHKFYIYNNYLPVLNTGSLKSCIFGLKRMLKNKECLTIMSLANGGSNSLGNPAILDGFSYEIIEQYKNTKSYKNFKLTK